MAIRDPAVVGEIKVHHVALNKRRGVHGVRELAEPIRLTEQRCNNRLCTALTGVERFHDRSSWVRPGEERLDRKSALKSCERNE